MSDHLMTADVDEIETLLLKIWGPAGGYSESSDYDLSDYVGGVSSHEMPEWRKHVHEAFHTQTDTSKSNRSRLYAAMHLAYDQGVAVPLHLLAALPQSTDPQFKAEETRFYEAEKRRRFPDIDASAAYNDKKFAEAVIVGRFDIAAQMFCAASPAKRRR